MNKKPRGEEGGTTREPERKERKKEESKSKERESRGVVSRGSRVKVFIGDKVVMPTPYRSVPKIQSSLSYPSA